MWSSNGHMTYMYMIAGTSHLTNIPQNKIVGDTLANVNSFIKI